VRRGTLIDYWWESQRERDHKEDQDVGGWIILVMCSVSTPGFVEVVPLSPMVGISYFSQIHNKQQTV
jgi:hypothetical protein